MAKERDPYVLIISDRDRIYLREAMIREYDDEGPDSEIVTLKICVGTVMPGKIKFRACGKHYVELDYSIIPGYQGSGIARKSVARFAQKILETGRAKAVFASAHKTDHKKIVCSKTLAFRLSENSMT